MIKKYIVSLLVGLAIVGTANAASTSVTVAAGVMTNLVTLINGSAKVTQFVLTSTGTNYGSVSIYDTPTNTTLYTNVAYSNILTYITNKVVIYTNYYGVITTNTNNASLVDVTNSVAGTTNNYPLRAALAVGTNATVRIDGVNYYFNEGIWITNGSGSSLTISATYQQ